jgi:hypothetical protein
VSTETPYARIPTTQLSTENSVAGWTLPTFARFMDERDRRYSEVAVEKEKALKIKEVADRDAKDLERSAQIYREQQNDAMRDKNLAQSGIYATNASVSQGFAEFRTELKPILDYISSTTGNVRGSAAATARLWQTVGGISILFAFAKSVGWF